MCICCKNAGGLWEQGISLRDTLQCFRDAVIPANQREVQVTLMQWHELELGWKTALFLAGKKK